MLKRLVSVLCSVVMVTSLVACGSSSSGTVQSTSTQSANVSATEKANDADEVVVLEMWTGWTEADPIYEIFEKGLASFEEQNPGIKVNHVTVGWDDMITKAVVGAAGGVVPNVVWGWDPTQFSGAYTDLTEWIENDATFDKESISSVGWDYVNINGEISALPATLESKVLLYNAKELSNYGIEKPASTMEEMENHIEQMLEYDANGNISKLGYWPGMELIAWGQGNAQWYYSWPALFGADWYDEATGKYTINTPETLAAYTWIREIADKIGVDALQKYMASNKEFINNIDGGTGPIYDNAVSYLVHAPWVLRINNVDGMDFQMSPAPTAENGAPLVTGCVWWAPKGCDHAEETWELLKFFAGEEWQELYFTGDPLLPSNVTAMESCADLEGYEWIGEVFVKEDLLATGTVPPRTDTFSAVGQSFFDRADDIFYSDTPLEDLLQEIEDLANSQ